MPQPASFDGDVLRFTLASLHVYPIKSCAGVALPESLLIETGLEFDRAWMLVDPDRRFVTQRELPRLALVQPTLKSTEMVLRAPGMLALHVALDRVEAPLRVTVWNDEVAAFDMGPLCAQWFSDYVGRPLRLVRFDPEQKRLADPAWCGDIAAENAFVDQFPLLVASTASLVELNLQLARDGHPPTTLARFRPNLVLDGLDVHGEDTLDEIAFVDPSHVDGDAGAGADPIRLKLVRPCTRCPIPDIDPTTAERGHGVGDVLARYRADARVGGRVTFGMQAVIVSGVEGVLRAGMSGEATYRFD